MVRLLSQSAVGKVRLLAGTVIAAAGLALLMTRASWASDHEDAPDLIGDPGVDIGDVYAFVRPGTDGDAGDAGAPTHLVLAVTVHPGATAATTFDTDVEYQFRVLGYDPVAAALDGQTDTRVTCRFEEVIGTAPQVMVCGVNGTSVFGTVGTATSDDGGDAFRVWAGLRADPAFGDIAALSSTIASKQLKFTDAGTNAFAGKNALAIVVEVAIDDVLLAGIDASAGRPQLAVSATTERL